MCPIKFFRTSFLLLMVLTVFTIFACADTVVLRSGSSYNGQLGSGPITFADAQGVKYEFPARDVQSLVFGTSDVITLRNGKSYSGHFTGSNPVDFKDAQGIGYQFPTDDLDAIIFNRAGTAIAPSNAKVIPGGADLSVRTNETIDSNSSYQGQTYSANITEDVLDTAGAVAIPAGSSAQLMVRSTSGGGAVHSPEVILDLYSVTLDKKQYRVATSDVDENNRKGVGKNRRTAEFLGGGSALGALMGGLFGGGKGAGVGALAGAGGGFVSQVFTRGKEVRVPAETTLRFRLEKPLVLQPGQ
jgi:hypothetical protein